MLEADRFQSFFCGMPCAPALHVGRTGALTVTGGCPACREEIAAFREEKRPPMVAGRGTTQRRALETAARILTKSRAPFVYGLSRSSTSTARKAAALAELIGAAVDVEGAEEVSADLSALQTFGLPGATFGEIRDRADLLLLWRCDPRRTHPHLFGRHPRPVSDGPPSGAAVVVAAAGAAGAPSDDLILPVGADGDLDAALALRALAGGASPAGEASGGVPRAALATAADRLRRARYSVIIWSAAATAGVHGPALASTLTLLARDLNRCARSVARPLGAGGNVTGAMAALAAATGYPRAVGLGPGGARYAPAELDASRMIGGRRADAILYLGARTSGGIKEDTKGGRRADAAVVVGPCLPMGVGEPEVWIPTATPGLTSSGTALRTDGVTVVLRALLPTRRPSEDEVLEALTQQLR